jgi:hypothetical protein
MKMPRPTKHDGAFSNSDLAALLNRRDCGRGGKSEVTRYATKL